MMAETLSSKAWDGHNEDGNIEADGTLEKRGEGEILSNGDVGMKRA